MLLLLDYGRLLFPLFFHYLITVRWPKNFLFHPFFNITKSYCFRRFFSLFFLLVFAFFSYLFLFTYVIRILNPYDSTIKNFCLVSVFLFLSLEHGTADFHPHLFIYIYIILYIFIYNIYSLLLIIYNTVLCTL